MKHRINLTTTKVIDRMTTINVKKRTVTVVYDDGVKETIAVPDLARHDSTASVGFRNRKYRPGFDLRIDDGENEFRSYRIATGASPLGILDFADGRFKVGYSGGGEEWIAHEAFKNVQTFKNVTAYAHGLTVDLQHTKGTTAPLAPWVNLHVASPYTPYVPPAEARPVTFEATPVPPDRLRIVVLHPAVTEVAALPAREGWRVATAEGPVIDVCPTGWRKEYGADHYKPGEMVEIAGNKYSYVIKDHRSGKPLVRIDAVDLSKSFEAVELHGYLGVVTVSLDGGVAKPAAPRAPRPAEFASSTDITDMRPWPIIDAVLPHTQRTLLYGPPGTGKTHAAVKAGKTRADQPVYAITLTDETPMTELRGHFVMKDREFVWQDGIAVRAWREGARLVLNEIDHAGGDVMSFLHVILDDVELAQLALPTGEIVRPDPNFQVVATMNGVPEDLPFALRDRFPVSIAVNEVHPAAVAQLSEDLRAAATNSTLATDPQRRTSIRVWAEFGQLRASLSGHALGKQIAASACFGHRAQEVLDGIAIGGTK